MLLHILRLYLLQGLRTDNRSVVLLKGGCFTCWAIHSYKRLCTKPVAYPYFILCTIKLLTSTHITTIRKLLKMLFPLLFTSIESQMYWASLILYHLFWLHMLKVLLPLKLLFLWVVLYSYYYFIQMESIEYCSWT